MKVTLLLLSIFLVAGGIRGDVPSIRSGVSLQGPTNSSLTCYVDDPARTNWTYNVRLYRKDNDTQVANINLTDPYYQTIFTGLAYCTSYYAKAWFVNSTTGERQATPSVSAALSTLCDDTQPTRPQTSSTAGPKCSFNQTYDVTKANFVVYLMSAEATRETINIDDGDRYIDRYYHVQLSEVSSGKIAKDFWLECKEHAITLDELKPNTEYRANATLVNKATGATSKTVYSEKLRTLNGTEIKGFHLYSQSKGYITYQIDDPGRTQPWNYTMTFIDRGTGSVIKTVNTNDYSGWVNGFTSGKKVGATVSFSRPSGYHTGTYNSSSDVTIA